MRHVTIGTASSLFKKGKETNTTKRRSQEDLGITEGVCQDTDRKGQVRAVSFYKSSAEKFPLSLPLAKWSGKCYYKMCVSS